MNFHTIEIPEANQIFYLPKELSYCNEKQYVDMCQLIMLFQTGELTYEEMRAQAVYKLLNMKHSPSILQSEEENKLSNIYLISELIDSFFDIDDNGQKNIKLNFLENPVPKTKLLSKTLYGPSSLFQNLQYDEYTDALRTFHQFNATPDQDLLISLASIIYKPKKPFIIIRKLLGLYNGNPRAPHNPNTIKTVENQLKYAPIGFLYGVYLMFASFQKALSTINVPWAGKTLNFSILYDQEIDDTLKMPGIGFDALTFLIAESGTFGEKEKLARTPLWEVLIKLYDMRVKHLNEKEQHDNNQSS